MKKHDNHSEFHAFSAAAMALAIAIASGVAVAQSRPMGEPLVDPARWHTEDATPQARYQTAKKEAGAAYQEALWACKKMAAPERPTCQREARDQYNLDLAAARKRLSE